MQAIKNKLTKAEKSRIKTLFTRKGRTSSGRFAAEGVRLLEESLRHKFLPDLVYYSPAEISDRGKTLVDKIAGYNIPLIPVSARDITQIAETETSQGIIACFKIPRHFFRKLINKRSRILLLDNLSDPGNAGTLIRSALAFGFNMVLMTPGSVEPYNPKVIRASAGAIFGLPVINVQLNDVGFIKNNFRIPLMVGDMSGVELSAGLAKLKKSRGFILAVGSEAEGVDEKLKAMSDIKLSISHCRKVESLNAAVAGSILMKDLYYFNLRTVQK